MSDVEICPNCGARFSPDVSGACRYCHVQLVTGPRPTDPDLLAGRIRGVLSQPGGAERLGEVVGRLVPGSTQIEGHRKKRTVTFRLVDYVITLSDDHGAVSGEGVQEVRGVVLSRTPLDLGAAAQVLATSLSRLSLDRPDLAGALAQAF